VTLANGRTVAAQLAGMDHATDLAVLKLAETETGTEAAPVAPQGDATRIVAGHFVAALGRSAGGDLAASAGIVHRTGPGWQTWTGGRIDRLIRLDGGLFAGLSGGPVFDARGGVIGIANGALVRGGAVVVPATTIDRVIDELLARGRVARPYLGIIAQPVRLPASGPASGPAAAAAAVAGEPAGDTAMSVNSRPAGTGLLVTGLDDAGPAHAAGLMVGDIVHTVAGMPVADIAALRGALATRRTGASVTVAVLRGGTPVELTLVAGEAPAPQAATEGCCR
jgi:S1-C subfamily serine protease